jgi:type VI protein secretion system component VasK
MRRRSVGEYPVLVAVVGVLVAILWLVGAHMTASSERRSALTYLDQSCADIEQIIDNPQIARTSAATEINDALLAAQRAADDNSRYGAFDEEMRQAQTDLVADRDLQAALPVLERMEPVCSG